MGLVVEFAVAADLSNHQRRKDKRHEGHRFHGLFHFEFDLIAEVLGVLESLLVEYEEVRQRSEDIVDDQTK